MLFRSIEDSSPNHFVPTLVYPPMPESVIEELEDTYLNFSERVKRDPVAAEEYRAQRKAEEEAKLREREARIQAMKTPMQVKWELAQAKKPKYDPKQPTLPSQALLVALGQHMAMKGKKLDRQTALKASENARKMRKPVEGETAAGELLA